MQTQKVQEELKSKYPSTYHGPVIYSGNIKSEIGIIGINPGKVEIEKDTPFIGPSGNLLWNSISEKRENLFISNTHWFCNEKYQPLTLDEALYNKALFIDLINNTFQGNKLILLSKFVKDYLDIPEQKNEVIFDLKIGNKDYKAIALYHPSYFIRQGKVENKEYYAKYFQMLNKTKQNLKELICLI